MHASRSRRTVGLVSTHCSRALATYTTMATQSPCTFAHNLCTLLQVLDEDGSRYIELPEFAKLYQNQVRFRHIVHRTCGSQPLQILATCCSCIRDNCSLAKLCLWLQLKKPDSVLTP